MIATLSYDHMALYKLDYYYYNYYENFYFLALSIFISHLWRILFIPVHNVLVSQYYNVTFAIAMLQRTTDHIH